MTAQDIGMGHSFWRGMRRYDKNELFFDAAIHAIGLAIAMIVGGWMLAYASIITAPEYAGALTVYVVSMIALLIASLLFNQWGITPMKRHLARLDQAAIFIFIAGTYTPILVLLGEGIGEWLLPMVWVIAVAGVVLKVLVPGKFGRIAIPLHLVMGWGGLLVVKEIMTELHPMTIWLLVAGGVSYSIGIIFHLDEKMRFHNVFWHVAVVIGMTLHLMAIANCMVLSRM